MQRAIESDDRLPITGRPMPAQGRALAAAAPWSIVLVYAAVVGTLLWRHAMWRDEAQLWLIGATQSSLTDVWATMDQEIRPLTWVTITWLLGRLTSEFEVLKILNFAVAVATAWVVVFLLPLRRVEQVLLLSGVLFLTGYSVVSNDYMLSTLFLVLTVAGIVRRWKPASVIVLIGLLGSTHPLFMLIAAALLAGVVVERYWPWGEPPRRPLLVPRQPTDTRQVGEVAALVFAVTAIAFAALTAWPGEGNIWRPDPSFAPFAVLIEVSHGLTLALVPSLADVPPPGPVLALMTAVAAVVVAVLVVAAWRLGRGLGMAGATAIALLLGNRAFGFQNPLWWHTGATSLAVIVLIVLVGPWQREQRASSRWVLAVSLPVLSLQMVASFTEPGSRLWGDRPYSSAKAVAAFVESACPDGCALVMDVDYRASAISAYLGGQSIYYVNGGYWGTFTVPTPGLYDQPTWPEVIDAARAIGDPLIVTNVLRGAHEGAELLAEFDEDLWTGEDFAVYRLSPASPEG